MEFKHQSVMLEEVLEGLNLKPDGVYVDCTLGGGGHSLEILRRTAPKGKLIGLDQDPIALEAASSRLAEFQGRFIVRKANFVHLAEVLAELKVDQVDGFLFDLGISSPQVDNPERGFSYMQDAVLDMRMNPENPCTAEILVNTLSEDALAKIIREYGEENWSKRIAEFIVREREKKPVRTTFELVEIIKKAVPVGARRAGPHPAKRTFQALRIAVNDELNILKSAFEQGIKRLKPGGRMAVITFHSLEDRITKECFKYLALDCICPPELPVCCCDKESEIKIITRKPILPSEKEVAENPRARSAKLRVAEKR